MAVGLEADPAAGRPAETLSVVIPCYNERDNVVPLVKALHAALAGLEWEAIFVDDDSPDGTAAAVRRAAGADPRLRCLRRIGRRGLSSAVIEGALASSATYVAVMDGDLQHDEARLPALLDAVRDGADIAVGSRHVTGGDQAGLSGAWRRGISATGARLARRLLGIRLADPMSGFFLLRRDLFEALAPRLGGAGFKILLDLVLSSPRPLRLAEVPCRFRRRAAGESKLDALVLLQFGAMLLDKRLGGAVPLRFVAFALVGLVGVAVNLAVLDLARVAGAGFAASQLVGTLAAMVANFWPNNTLTYRDQRLRGRALGWGLFVFMVVCAFGAAADIGVAGMLYAQHAGWTPAGAAGAAIAVVWNYAVSSTLVWRRR